MPLKFKTENNSIKDDTNKRLSEYHNNFNIRDNKIK